MTDMPSRDQRPDDTEQHDADATETPAPDQHPDDAEQHDANATETPAPDQHPDDAEQHDANATETPAPDQHPDDDTEQLPLLPTSDAHVRFLLSRETRERGLRHVAEIRRQLAERKAARNNVHHLPPRHHDAA